MNDVVAVIFSLVAIQCLRSAFRGVLSEQRTPVDAIDLIVAVAFLLIGAFIAGFALWKFHDSAPLWFWPIMAMSVGGWISMSVRSALGVPLKRTRTGCSNFQRA